MLKQSELSEEEQAEAFRRADALFRAESEQARTARSAAAAAEELGIPQEYLDRAAAQVHAEKIDKIKSARRRLRLGIFAAVAAAGGIGLFTLFRTPPPSTLEITAATVGQNINPATKAFVSNFEGSLMLTVNRFGVESNGDYFANATLPAPSNLGRYRTVSFKVLGSGDLSAVRLDFQGDRMRWKSSSRPVSGGRVSIDLRTMQRQEQAGSGWRNVSYRAPENVREIAFKVGETVNPPDAQGTLTISDVRFE